MEMCTGGLPRVPYLGNFFSQRHRLPLLDAEFTAMRIKGGHTPVVAELKIESVGRALSDIIHHSVRKCSNGISVGRCQIHSRMELLSPLDRMFPPTISRGDCRHNRSGGLLQAQWELFHRGVVRKCGAGVDRGRFRRQRRLGTALRLGSL